tara:strand:- start:21358 stop:23382 length:2025 start_codon:yes stop_codon:yes gene_type:complete
MEIISKTLNKLSPVIDEALLKEFSLPDNNETEFWKADWFLSKFNDNIWIIKRYNNKNLPIYWNALLPNGDHLTDKAYISLLHTFKKLIFLVRQGYAFLSDAGANPETTRAQQQYAIFTSLLLIIRWMILRGDNPALTGFRSFTRGDLEQLVKDAKFGRQNIDGTYEMIEALLTKAKSEGNLETYLLKKKINYSKVFKELELTSGLIDNPLIPSLRLQAALNKQFEDVPLPEYVDYKYSNGRELQSSRAQKFDEAINSTISLSSLSGMLIGLSVLGRFASILKYELLGLEWCAEVNIKDLGLTNGYKPNGRTPTIPVLTAMEYLDKSIAWIVDLGPEIVKVKQDCDTQLKSMMKDTSADKDHYSKKVILNIPDSLQSKLRRHGLEIKRYNKHQKNNAFIRENMTIENATECLIAAAFIVINTFACKRISEVLDLNQNCSRPALDGGWEIIFGLRKASPTESLSLIGRPIPDVSEMAIDLLIDLFPLDVIPNDDNFTPLFLSNYNVNRKPVKVRKRSIHSMYRCLELFSDVIEVTPDKENKRWYLRSHELRRFFAITYFWHDRFAGLPALSWFMGHSDTEETMRYVLEIIVGDEMPEEEARFAASIMQAEDVNLRIDGMEILESDAKKYFDVDTLKLIDEKSLEAYLKLRFEEGYRIVKHGHELAKIIFLEEHYDN